LQVFAWCSSRCLKSYQLPGIFGILPALETDAQVFVLLCVN